MPLDADRRGVFGDIYKAGLWRLDISLSGAGSDRKVAAPYVQYVLDTVAKNDISSVLDIGHGDWEMWPPHSFEGIDYTGVDVAGGLSEQVAARYATPSRKFRSLDAVQDPLPQADLVLLKEVLQHLSNDEIEAVLRKLTRYRMVIICSDIKHPSWRWWALRDGSQALLGGRFRAFASRFKGAVRASDENADIDAGGYRPLNLEKAPWDLEKLGLRIVDKKDMPDPIWNDHNLERRVWTLVGTGAAP
jgi:hypothetical protein